MSEERLSPEQAEALRLLGPLEGQKVAGGCTECKAYQTVEPVSGGVWMLSVHHDPDCPVLAAHERRQP